MATTPTAPPPRHALGLPAGSIRALLALGVLGYLWALFSMLRGGQAEQATMPFIYFNVVMVLILAHFFAAHGSSIGHRVSRRSPLGLPSGSVRILLLAGYLGLAYYLYATQPNFDIKETGNIVLVVTVLLSCFVVGYVLTGLVRGAGGGVLPAWFQDVQGWFALLGLLVLAVLVLMRLVINPSVAPENQRDLFPVEIALAGLVGFYFGARS